MGIPRFRTVTADKPAHANAADDREAGSEESGAPGRIRTPNLLIRSQTLYPVELRALSEAGHYSRPLELTSAMTLCPKVFRTRASDLPSLTPNTSMRHEIRMFLLEWDTSKWAEFSMNGAVFVDKIKKRRVFTIL